MEGSVSGLCKPRWTLTRLVSEETPTEKCCPLNPATPQVRGLSWAGGCSLPINTQLLSPCGMYNATEFYGFYFRLKKQYCFPLGSI